ncbi:Trypsin-like peptidase domain-containing protein [Sulfidibacter corallicola]|uniref:Trypsin-like peptidase domain-containing protein n=1 Tax=Sulfidibacter corallicola TaxID=2818388 RepID=A0A8A4TSB0_SULCO|nr:serine protease [Sulfidibacter corallicola]QTD51928.1 trypsin-like peptidase domain-containing protein [Sulfidibacter corallicola]
MSAPDYWLDQLVQAAQRFDRGQARRTGRRRAIEKLKRGDRKVSLDAIEEPERLAQRLLSMDLPGTIDQVVRNFCKGEAAPARERIEQVFLESIILQDDLVPIGFLHKAQAVARYVGRIVTKLGGRTKFGTGFMISDRLLLTNHHVLPLPSIARKSRVQFDYVEIAGGDINVPTDVALDPETLFVADKDLDFAVVAVQANHPPIGAGGWIPLISASGKAMVGERVNIIQHPGGEPQQIAIRANQIVDIDGHFLIYETDTRKGSSGSPVLNDQWQLAALHHAGVPRRDGHDRILLTDGEPWDRRPGTVHRIDWVANEGTRISSITAFLKEWADGQELAIKGLIENTGRQPPPTSTGLPPSLGSDSASATAPAWALSGFESAARMSSPQSDAASGTRQWTLPMTVTISIGPPQTEQSNAGGAVAPSPERPEPIEPPEDDVE